MKSLRLFIALLTFVWTILLPLSGRVEAAQVVRIGAVHFPPYVVRPENGKGQGLLAELVVALNRNQQVYEFVMVPTSIARRFRDFTQGRIDIVVFENPEWDWSSIPHTAVDMGLEDAEVFVARREPGRGQGYFTNLADKHLALLSGYHYGFAHFNADPNYLSSRFHATLTYSHESNLLMVARGRVDLAPVTRSFLKDTLVRNLIRPDQLLISERVDQVYRHYALVRPGAPLSGEQLGRLLGQTRANGQMKRIFEPLSIEVMNPGAVKAVRGAPPW